MTVATAATEIPSSEVTAIEQVAEAYLSNLARNAYLYEENDLRPLTLSSVSNTTTRGAAKQYSFPSGSCSANELLADLQYIDDIVSFDRFYRQAQGITRSDFEAGYQFSDPCVSGNTATIEALETLSFYYTDDPLNDEMTYLTNRFTVQLVKEGGGWYVADIADDASFSEDAKARGIDLESAMESAAEYIAAEQAETTTGEAFAQSINNEPEAIDESSTEGTVEMTPSEVEAFLAGLEQNNDPDIIYSDSNIAPAAVYSQTRYIPFNKDMALQYAYTYWYDDIDHNDNYGPNNIHRYWRNRAAFVDYGGSGGNCQNYTSQLVWAGLGGSNPSVVIDNTNRDVPMDNSGTYKWYGTGDWNVASSESWRLCSSFRNYAQNVRDSSDTGLVTTSYTLNSRQAPSQLSNYSTILPGSVLHVYNPGASTESAKDMGHAIYCTKVTGSTWSNVYYTANSNSAYNAKVGDNTTWVGTNAVKDHVGVTHITSYRDIVSSSVCSSHSFSNSSDATCSKCGYNRMVVYQNTPSSHMNIAPGPTKTIGGRVGTTSSLSSGSLSSLTCYRMALGVTKPSGQTTWYSKLNTYYINQSINFDEEGIWTIQVSARDQDESLSDSTAKTYTFKIRVIDYTQYNAVGYN